MILSKTHSKCTKCKYEDKCNNKRMVACISAEIPTNLEEMQEQVKRDIEKRLHRELLFLECKQSLR